MDSTRLRSLQAPLKELYRKNPESANITLIRLTERYCVVFQTLTNGVPVAVNVKNL